MTRTDKKVSDPPDSRQENAEGCKSHLAVLENALKALRGRWKMVIIFRLLERAPLRFSELERCIPAISQKMLRQQLRELERDRIVQRTIHPQVPPRVEYALTNFGQALRPALRALLDWSSLQNVEDV